MKSRPENTAELILSRLTKWWLLAADGETVAHRAKGRHRFYMLLKAHPEFKKHFGVKTISLTKIIFTKPTEKGRKRGQR
jgi:hypothetical protein